jgi:hypothetical protein
VREQREMAAKAKEYRLRFLRELKPEHPLYHTPEALAVRDANRNGKPV